MARFAFLTALTAALPAALAAFKEGCADAPWDSDIDFFETKFACSESETNPFCPEYNNTYVKIRNRQARFVLLHCTNEPPPEEITANSLVIKAPVESVAALDGFSQNLIDMLGMSHTIKRVGEYGTVTSSCVRGLMRENNTYDTSKWDEAPPVNVTFHGDISRREDSSQVLIRNDGNFAPMTQLSYLKFIGMFFGMEEQANLIYNAIAGNYRCAASHVNSLITQNSYPQGAFLSAVQKNGSELSVDQSTWWSVLTSDAGTRAVNISHDSEITHVNVAPDDRQNAFAQQSFAIVDTTQYLYTEDMSAAQERERLDTSAWKEEIGISDNIYAVRQQNIYLADKSTNRNRRHAWTDRGPARPDLVLRDLISIIQPEFDPSYITSFIRKAANPEDQLPQRRISTDCVVESEARDALGLTQCELPPGTGGYHSSGSVVNAYGTQTDDIESLALARASGLSSGAKAGISVGSILGGFAVIGVGIWLWLKKRNAGRTGALKSDTESGNVRKEMNVTEKHLSDSDSQKS